jgi:hypothetical protein
MMARAKRHARAHLVVLQLGIVMAEAQIERAETHPGLTNAERRDMIARLQRIKAWHAREFGKHRTVYQDTYGLRARIRRFAHQLRGYRQETGR